MLQVPPVHRLTSEHDAPGLDARDDPARAPSCWRTVIAVCRNGDTRISPACTPATNAAERHVLADWITSISMFARSTI